jgi:hypothetical protein
VSSHEKKLEFRFGGKHLDLSECVILRGAACKGGLWPAVAAMGASSPVGAVQSVTRVLERTNEEGSPHYAEPLLGPLGPCGVSLRKQLVRFVRRKAESGPKQGTTWLAAGCLGNLTTRQREAAN